MYKYVNSYTKDLMSFDNETTQQVLEEQIRKNDLYVKVKYCSLCNCQMPNEKTHIESKRHKQKQKQFYKKYHNTYKNLKQKIRKNKKIWGKSEGLKKIRLFTQMYNYNG